MSASPVHSWVYPSYLDFGQERAPDLDNGAFTRNGSSIDEDSSEPWTPETDSSANVRIIHDRKDLQDWVNEIDHSDLNAEVRSLPTNTNSSAHTLLQPNDEISESQEVGLHRGDLRSPGLSDLRVDKALSEAQRSRSVFSSGEQDVIALTKRSLSCSTPRSHENAKGSQISKPRSNRYEAKYMMQDPHLLPDAPKDRAGNHIFSYKLFRSPGNRKVKLHYITTLEEAEKKAKLFHRPLIGLDTEFKAGCSTHFKDRVSLIQLATEKDIGLFHIARFAGDDPSEVIPPTLKKLLESPKVIKTGSAVQGDATKIETFFHLRVKGVADLKRLLQIVHPEEKGQSARLSTMTKRYFGHGLDKDMNNRSRDWKDCLTSKQIEYAASDAYASLKIFQRIELDRQQKNLPSMLSLIASLSRETPWTLSARKRKLEPETLYDALHKLRNELALRSGVDGQRIMANATMREMAKAMPTTAAEVLKIPATKLSDFSAHAGEIADVVATFAADLTRSVKSPKTEGLSLTSPSSSQASIRTSQSSVDVVDPSQDSVSEVSNADGQDSSPSKASRRIDASEDRGMITAWSINTMTMSTF